MREGVEDYFRYKSDHGKYYLLLMMQNKMPKR
jgi:hypothetical protein